MGENVGAQHANTPVGDVAKQTKVTGNPDSLDGSCEGGECPQSSVAVDPGGCDGWLEETSARGGAREDQPLLKSGPGGAFGCTFRKSLGLGKRCNIPVLLMAIVDHTACLISAKYVINPRFPSLIILLKLTKSSAIFVFLVRKCQPFYGHLIQKDQTGIHEFHCGMEFIPVIQTLGHTFGFYSFASNCNKANVCML